MFQRVRSRLSYANVVSSFALFLALTTGGVYAANEWTGANIVDGSLTAADLAVGTIGTLRVQDDSLQAVDLKTDSVTTSEVLDDTLTQADLGNGSVGTDEVANESLTSNDLGTDSVGAAEIADNTIDYGEIIDNSVYAADLGIDAVGVSELATDAVGASELAANSVDGANVINNSITFSDIVGGSADGAVTYTAGGVPNGRCINTNWGVSGATAGDAAVIVARGPMQSGVFLYAIEVTAANNVRGAICNFSGGALQAITNLPVRIITFR